MTLVQASISNDGNTIVIIADRLLTKSFGEDFPSYEFESNSPKIISINNVGIGFAGSALYADMATLDLQFNILDTSSFDDIVDIISKFIKTTRESTIEDMVKKLSGISSEDFFSNSEIVPEEVRSFIYGWLMEFRLEFECILSGFDKNDKAEIVYITDDGSTFRATKFGVGSIGSGSLFSQIYFDENNYNTSISEIESLFFAFKAKKWAQAPTGVGRKTDIILLKKNGNKLEIRDEDDLMNEINNIYEEEKTENNKIRKELLNKLITNNSERLKWNQAHCLQNGKKIKIN